MSTVRVCPCVPTLGSGERKVKQIRCRRRKSTSEWLRAVAPPGERGEAPPYAWTSKNYVICVCFHCHETSSYHTTNTLQGRRATLIHRQYNRDWGTSYSRPPIDPYLTSPMLQNLGGATGCGCANAFNLDARVAVTGCTPNSISSSRRISRTLTSR